MQQLDELDLKRRQDAEITGDTCLSRFSGTCRLPCPDTAIGKATLRWSPFKELPAAEMLTRVRRPAL